MDTVGWAVSTPGMLSTEFTHRLLFPLPTRTPRDGGGYKEGWSVYCCTCKERAVSLRTRRSNNGNNAWERYFTSGLLQGFAESARVPGKGGKRGKERVGNGELGGIEGGSDYHRKNDRVVRPFVRG